MGLFGINLNSILNSMEIDICELTLNIVKTNMSWEEAKQAEQLLEKLKSGQSFSKSEVHELGENINMARQIIQLSERMENKKYLSQEDEDCMVDLSWKLKSY